MVENVAFVRSGLADDDDPRPDIMFVVLSGHMGTDGTTNFGDYLGLSEEQVREIIVFSPFGRYKVQFIGDPHCGSITISSIQLIC